MTVITTTILLPFIAMSRPMAGPQHVTAIFVGSHSQANDELLQAYTGLGWWNRRYSDVTWTLTAETRPLPVIDPFTIDMCDASQRQSYLDELGLLPDNAIVLIDSYWTGQHFQCHGEPRGVLDYTVPGRAILETSMAASDDFGLAVAHVIGHMYGAPDTNNGDIMDFIHIWRAYDEGIVSDATARAIGRR